MQVTIDVEPHAVIVAASTLRARAASLRARASGILAARRSEGGASTVAGADADTLEHVAAALLAALDAGGNVDEERDQ